MAKRKVKKKKMRREIKVKGNRINRCEVTDEKLSGRGGLALFSRYINNIGIICLPRNFFGSLRKNEKGFDIVEIFLQILIFFVDQTNSHLVRFDELKKDEGYAAIMLIEGCRPDTIMYTDIGTGGAIDRRLREAGVTDIFAAEKIIRCYHDRGRDESVNRSVKDFYGEKLPFKRFYKNAAFFRIMLIAFFLFECFKMDVASDSIPPAAYPTTVRRRLIDIAAKVISRSGAIILKVTRAVQDGLNFMEMWRRSGSPPALF